MTPVVLQLPSGSGLLEAFAQVASAAAMLLILLMLVALGTYVYKQTRGDGIEWPDEDEQPGDDGLKKGGSDDEWKYY